MDTIFMNSEKSRTSEYHVLVLKLPIRSKKKSKEYCFIKSLYLLYIEKHKFNITLNLI